MNRRQAIAAGGWAVAAVGPLSAAPGAALAAEGDWAKHEGPYDDAFFADFKSTKTGFLYKFVNEGTGAKPEDSQKVFVNYAGASRRRSAPSIPSHPPALWPRSHRGLPGACVHPLRRLPAQRQEV